MHHFTSTIIYNPLLHKFNVSLYEMCKLIDDITSFLESKGFECSQQMRNGHEVICVPIHEGGRYKVVLPLEINSPTPKDAEAEGCENEEHIKFIEALEGYPLIITEDRWHRQRDMMEMRLLAHMETFSQIYARNCEVRRIDKETAETFLHANHSYGYAACRYRYGLYLKRHTGHNSGSMMAPGTLVAVATFSNARRWRKGERDILSYEWVRYASLPQLRLCGGMGKMLKTFIDEVGPDDIMSYADLEWSKGSVYKELGFYLEDHKDPVLFSVDPDTWERRAVRKAEEPGSDILYFQNFGSNKYRLKLTEYK